LKAKRFKLRLLFLLVIEYEAYLARLQASQTFIRIFYHCFATQPPQDREQDTFRGSWTQNHRFVNSLKTCLPNQEVETYVSKVECREERSKSLSLGYIYSELSTIIGLPDSSKEGGLI